MDILKTLSRHHHMVFDPYRTPLVKQAIQALVKPGDVVLDLGSGLGILSFFAVECGAKTVYAIDTDPGAMAAAQELAKTYDPEGRIQFIDGLSYDIQLPEKVDIIVCEIIGSLAFEENILATLSDAKKRFLKRGGKMIPEKIELWGALTEKASTQNDWKAIAIPPASLLSETSALASVDTAKTFSPNIHVKYPFRTEKQGTLGGVAVWPKITWWKKIVTDAAPTQPLTHWKQGHLPIERAKIKPGEKWRFELLIHPDSDTPQTQTEILWKLTSAT